MYEVKDERHAEAFWKHVSLAKEDALPMGERLKALQKDTSGLPSNVKLGPGGSREISFTTRNSAKYKEDEEDKGAHQVKRRGIQSLGLKSDGSRSRGRGRARGGYRGNGRRGRR